jgi:hypothetical protein
MEVGGSNYEFYYWDTNHIKKHDFFMVVVDTLFKETHFIHVKPTHKTDGIAKKFMMKILILHGLPNANVFDRDTKFTSNFWKSLFEDFGSQLNFILHTIHRKMCR